MYLLIYTTNDDLIKEKRYFKMLVNSKVDGIIIDSVANIDDDKYYKSLANTEKGTKRIPVVSIERNLSKYGIFSVYVNNVLGAYLATKHLLDSGCKRIIHIGGPMGIEMVLHRTTGYRNALREAGMEILQDYESNGDFSPFSGYRELKKFINGGIQFDGIFADNDQMAIGAIKALKENGYKIPGDVKVVGFDNTFVSSIVKPALTTINVPKYRMGWEATETLCMLMNDPEKEMKSFSMELVANLLERESTNGAELENWDLEGW
ncbi:MAG: substrate-binding domain-containing protein [Hungatella sp.]